jgi:hypothetical protein
MLVYIIAVGMLDACGFIVITDYIFIAPGPFPGLIGMGMGIWDKAGQ